MAFIRVCKERLAPTRKRKPAPWLKSSPRTCKTYIHIRFKAWQLDSIYLA